jgi:YD repeat-containing protein
LSTGNYNQWNNYFDMYLGYDNKDGVFASAQYNGNITGVLWKSQGDNSSRKYDFTYDYVYRFQSALFKQKNKPADAWSSANMDFSVFATYDDGNGNLKSLKQMGVVPGAGIVIADYLKYFYKDVPGVGGLTGNQLKRIDDQGTMGINNGLLSDFKDGSNAAGSDDYTYDANGNMVKDLNKNIVEGNNNGITYSYLDKPVRIVLQNKSIVEYTYDATGQKIAKKVTNTLTHSSKISTLPVYRNDRLFAQRS